jgi:hypothetical protein
MRPKTRHIALRPPVQALGDLGDGGAAASCGLLDVAVGRAGGEHVGDAGVAPLVLRGLEPLPILGLEARPLPHLRSS